MAGTPLASETAVPTPAPATEVAAPPADVDAVDRAIDGRIEDNYYNNLSLTDLMTAINPQMISELQAAAPNALHLLMNAHLDSPRTPDAVPASHFDPTSTISSATTTTSVAPFNQGQLPAATSPFLAPVPVTAAMLQTPHSLASDSIGTFAPSADRSAFAMGTNASALFPLKQEVCESDPVVLQAAAAQSRAAVKTQPLPLGVTPGAVPGAPFQTRMTPAATSPSRSRERGDSHSSSRRPRRPLTREKPLCWDDPAVIAAADAVRAEAAAAAAAAAVASAAANARNQYSAPAAQPALQPAIQPAMSLGSIFSGSSAQAGGAQAGSGVTMVTGVPVAMARGAGGVQLVTVAQVVCGSGGAAAEMAREEEARKTQRAERNRHSAASSRERKKRHLGELERRVAQLSRRNAQLQLEQMDAVRKVINREKRLGQENKQLRREVLESDMRISKLGDQLSSVGLGESHVEKSRRFVLSRPKTWDAPRLPRLDDL
eukprot:IDg1940t1